MTRTIRALRLDTPLRAPHRAALAVAAGRFRPELFRGGAGSPLQLRQIPAPERPPGWVRVRPTLAGICGSDRKFLHLTSMGFTVTALYGLPRSIVLGHEVVGVVTESDGAVAEGTRVVVDPTLSCTDRGHERCPGCAAGSGPARCENTALAGRFPAGHGIGHTDRYGGGWSEELVAPVDRLHVVPDTLDDRAAVLAEPTAICAHAVLRDPPPAGGRILVIGPGPIGLSLVHVLRCVVPDAEVTVAGLSAATDELARAAGADATIAGSRRVLVEAAGERLGTPVLGTRLSGPVLRHGFDVVYDTVGSEQTLDDALRMTRAGGRVVLVGTSSRQNVDWTLVWAREIDVQGSLYYGHDAVPDGAALPSGARHSFQVALEVLGAVDAGRLVTHIFPLDESVAALETADAGPAAGAVKVAFDPAA